MDLKKLNMEELAEASKPLIKYLNEAKFHPHMKVIVDCTSAELVEGTQRFCTEEFIKD